ncbi:response regulator transcription factor [Hufsiella ginkgonis]|uniref:Response regulator n=1 Tax=Hufsiella ginkgonis TaxID=2695274 RepID=A0A7K1Y1X6_9SPHI|nr:response regulator transcription factor [Hufsiella ginkgonis]MXV16686.1 response regulator [Hufsiella ginkgonis]
MINIILAEDHMIVRKGIRSLLEEEPDFRITGEVVSITELMDLLNDGTDADIILAEMNMKQLPGPEIIKNARLKHPHIKIIFLSTVDRPPEVLQMIDAGASGYLIKNIRSAELFFAIRQVHSNSPYYCAEIVSWLIQKHLHPESAPLLTTADPGLSRREKEVLNLLAEGYNNQEIADKLFSSKRTIEGHKQNMLGKMQCRNTISMVSFAFKNGMIK